MVERNRFLMVLTHLIMIVGVLVVAFPVYLTFVASTHTTQEVVQVPMREKPLFLLMAHSAETADLAPRLAAALGTGLVTRAMDLKMDAHGKVTAVQPIANGYLFQELEFESSPRTS